MKTIKIFSIVLFLICFKSQAQNSGLFLSEQDFLTGHVSVEVRYPEKISIGSKSAVIVKGKSGKEKYPFEKVYGYKKDGQLHRSFGKKSTLGNYGYYKVEEQGALVIYSQRIFVPKSGFVSAYYYSFSLSAPVKPLSRKNLLEDFALNSEFAEFLLSSSNRKLVEKKQGGFMVNEAAAEFGVKANYVSSH